MDDGTSTLDETKCVQSMVEQCNNIAEAKYLLDRMLNALLEKGEAVAKAEYEKKVRCLPLFIFVFKFAFLHLFCKEEIMRSRKIIFIVFSLMRLHIGLIYILV